MRGLLRDVRDDPFGGNFKLTHILMNLVTQQRKQARFTRAIRPDQANFMAGKQGEIGAHNQLLDAASQGEIGQF